MKDNYKDISPDKKDLLWRQCKKGSKEARDKLVELNLALVGAVARGYAYDSEEYREIFHGGIVGLIKAIDGFQPHKGVKFASYAFPFIRGEILRQKEGIRGVKRDRSAEVLSSKLKKFSQEFEEVHQKSPTVEQAAQALNVTPEQIILAQEGIREVPQADENAEEGAEDGSYTSVENRIFLSQILQELDPRERSILQERYFAGKTQSQLGQEMGISQTRVSRLEKEALVKLKNLAAR